MIVRMKLILDLINFIEVKPTEKVEGLVIGNPFDFKHEIHVKIDVNSETGFQVSFLKRRIFFNKNIGTSSRMGRSIKEISTSKISSFRKPRCCNERCQIRYD